MVKLKRVLSWAADQKEGTRRGLGGMPQSREAGTDRRLMYHIDTATPVEEYRLNLRFRDGFEGVVSLSAQISKGGVFAFLSDAARFGEVRIGEDGRWIFWTDPDGDEIDLCADALCYEAEEQAVEEMIAAE